MSVAQLEQRFSLHFTPEPLADLEYIVELLFSGLCIQPDVEFRARIASTFPHACAGDERVILARVNETVGHGVFAAQRYEIGELIVSYGGRISKANQVEDRSYAMSSGIEGFVLDATRYRNMGGFVNHSKNPNAEAQCIFDRGREFVVLMALKRIERGEQILIDYTSQYWGADGDTPAPAPAPFNEIDVVLPLK